jgi:uncharacterized protein YbjT (DUF2867 family)
MSVLGIDRKPSVGLQRFEKNLANSGIGYTILHPNWFMQIFSHGFFLPRVRDVSSIQAPVGTGAVSFVDTRDVAAVVASALTDASDLHAGKTYPLTGARALTYDEVADTLADVTDRRIAFRDVEEVDFGSDLDQYFEPDQRDYAVNLFTYVRKHEQEQVDPALANVLGREPTTFEQFARDHAAVWR